MMRLVFLALLLASVSGCQQNAKAGPLTCSKAAQSAGASVESYLFGVKTTEQHEELAKNYELIWKNDFWHVYRYSGFAFRSCSIRSIDGVNAYPVVNYRDTYQFLLGSLVIKVTDPFDSEKLTELGYPDRKPDRLNRIILQVNGDLDQAIADLEGIIGVEYVFANITKPIIHR